MRRLFLISLGCHFFSFLAAQQPTYTVVTTTSILADITKTLAGDFIEVKTLVPLGKNPHTYRLTAADVQTISAADVVFYNGLGLEPWLDTLLQQAAPMPVFVRLTEGIEPINKLPNAWMNPRNGILYSEQVKNALVQLDPANQEIYDFNQAVYKQQLHDLDQTIQAEIHALPKEQRVVVTTIEALRYYAEAYGLEVRPPLAEEKTIDERLYINSLDPAAAPTYYDLLKHDAQLLKQDMAARDVFFAEPRRSAPWKSYWWVGICMVLALSAMVFWFIKWRD